MKKSILITLFAVIVGIVGTFAQTSFEKTKRLTDSEVPVAVLKAFQQEHADAKGMWKLYYTEEKIQGKTTFTPTYYSFVGKKDGEKVVFNYAPDGTPTEGKGSAAKK